MAPPRRKKSTTATESRNEPTAAAVAEISAASVGGYLRNVAHRHRVPRAEGGKGTRRKVAMVTSYSVPIDTPPTSVTQTEAPTADTAKEEKQQEGLSPLGRSENNTRDTLLRNAPPFSRAAVLPPAGGWSENTEGEEEDEEEWDEVLCASPAGVIAEPQDFVVKPEWLDPPPPVARGSSSSDRVVVGVKRSAVVDEETDGAPKKERRVESTIAGTSAFEVEVLKPEVSLVGGDLVSSVEGGPIIPIPLKVEGAVSNSDGLECLPCNPPSNTLDEKLQTSVPLQNSCGRIEVNTAEEEGDFLSSDVRFGRGTPIADGDSRAGSSGWNRRDPAYEEMRERRDQLAAKRRSERMQRIFVCVTEIIALCCRGHWMWREARHPKMLRRLLQLRGDQRTPSSGGDMSASNTSASHFTRPLLTAVQEARAVMGRAPSSTKASLAPAWVNLDQDGVKDNTSAAVQVLLRAIHSTFDLSPETTGDNKDEASHVSMRNDTEILNGSGREEARKPQDFIFHRWSTPLKHQLLYNILRSPRLMQPQGQKISLPHPLYFSLVLLSLAALSGLDARLVIAKGAEKFTDPTNPVAAESFPSAPPTLLPHPPSLSSPLLTIYGRRRKGSQRALLGQRDTGSDTLPGAAQNIPAKKTRPSSCFWVEVWSPEREMFFSVNPCKGVTTLWGAPYAFAFGKGRVVDVTARYTSSLSRSYQYQHRLGKCIHYRFLWGDSITWDDTREISDVLLESCCRGVLPVMEQMKRECRQLEALHYSEKVPTTLAQLHRHPLFVIEADLGRAEGIYPKDKHHIVGSVKGHTVYKRSAVQALRSRDGWIREGRSISEDESPYKVVPPPASRPFASPASFFGFWQTKPFQPVSLQEDGSLPQHGNTRWYVLLHFPPPTGIAHVREPNIVRVARRMQLDFRFAVIGFEHKKVQENRRGNWVPLMDGIVVREKDKSSLLKAYHQWVKNMEEQVAAKRRDRAFHWWMLLSQRLLAADRLQAMYCRGNAVGSLSAR